MTQRVDFASEAFFRDPAAGVAKLRAIALCSLTTIVGYFSLVIAQSGALRTFGWAARK